MLDFPSSYIQKMDNTLRDLAFATLQSISEAIIVIDDKAIIHLINGAACHLLETTPDDAVGTPLMYLTEGVLKADSSYTQNWIFEVNERRLFFEASPIPEYQNSQSKRILITVIDNTTEILASELLTSLVCELRPPLAAIRGYSQLLLEDFEGSLTDEQRDFVNVIDRSVDGISKTIDEILEKYAGIR